MFPITFGCVVIMEEDETTTTTQMRHRGNHWFRFKNYLLEFYKLKVRRSYDDLKRTELMLELILEIYTVIYRSDISSSTYFLLIGMLGFNAIHLTYQELRRLSKYITYFYNYCLFFVQIMTLLQTVAFIVMLIGIIEVIGAGVFFFIPLQCLNLAWNAYFLFRTEIAIDIRSIQDPRFLNTMRSSLLSTSFVSFYSMPLQFLWTQKLHRNLNDKTCC